MTEVNRRIFNTLIFCEFLPYWTLKNELKFTNYLDDKWLTLKKMAKSRNILVWDEGAKSNRFTPKLVFLMKNVMTTNAADNLNHKLTDIYLSRYHLNTTLRWQFTNFSKMDFKLNYDGTIKQIFGVNLHECNSMLDTEVLGLDLTNLNGVLNNQYTLMGIINN